MTPVSDCVPLLLFSAMAVLPTYSVEFPNTVEGMVPVRLPAVSPDKLAPDPENVVAVNVPVLGLYVSLLLDVLATV